MKNKLNCVYLKHLLKKNMHKGFTQSELLFVIVITRVMPAIIMPCVLHHHNLQQTQVSLRTK